VKPFPNNRVTLDAGSGGLFTANRDRDLQFLNAYPVDNILFLFRQNAGLPTKDGRAIGNWDVANGNLRGHYSGHFMSALALAYAGGAGDEYKAKLDYIVQGLGECQAALAAAAAVPTPRVTGKFGTALNLSGCGTFNTGNSECVSLPVGIVNGLTDFTIAMWVNLTARTTSSAIFDFGTSNTSHMYIIANAAGNRPQFGITIDGTAGLQAVSGDSQLPTGTWTHIAVTLSGGMATLYVNGVAAGTNSSMTLTPSSLGTTTANWIGRSQFPMRSVEFLNAAIDEFQIYDRAFTSTEVQALTTSADGDLGGNKVAWYRFDETDGPTAVDSSGNGRDAHIFAPTDRQRHPGFLAAYPETQFIRLEEFATYSPIWAPWYTNHMTMRGLLDAYLHAGNEQALAIVKGMADWAHSRLTKLPRTTLDSMWHIYIAGEYNAMPEVLADLAAITGNTDYLETAECFVNTYLFDAAVSNQDTLNGEHANQHIPQYRGYLAIYDNFGDTVQPTYRAPASQYYTAAVNFWDMVVPHRMYVDGGQAGSGEIFGARDVIAQTIQASNSETCCSYNMLKLSRQLFFHTADPKYMQFYERTLLGVYLSDRSTTNSNTNPLVVYFLPVNPGARRSYGNLGTCDGGTAIEQLVKLQDSIYFTSVDDSALYVNLYLASTLNWAEKGVTIEQSTNYPADPAGETSLTVTGSGSFTMKLRVPYWVRKGFAVRINGEAQNIDATPGTYVEIKRDWTSGDTVEISMPFSVRADRALDQPQTQGLAFGPVPLITLNTSTSYLTYSSMYPKLGLSGDLAGALTASATPMQFSFNGNTVRPFYVEDTAQYHAYIHRSEPEIAFGSVDSGVPNYAQSDGTTFLDLVWDQAPFMNLGAFQAAVATLATRWLEAGMITSAEKDAIAAAAAKAHLH